MKEKIDLMLKNLSQMTKEQADFIEEILKWNDEERAAFMFAKRIFEEQE